MQISVKQQILLPLRNETNKPRCRLPNPLIPNFSIARPRSDVGLPVSEHWIRFSDRFKTAKRVPSGEMSILYAEVGSTPPASFLRAPLFDQRR